MQVSDSMSMHLGVLSTYTALNVVFCPRQRCEGTRSEEVAKHQSKRKIGVILELSLFFEKPNKLLWNQLGT